MDIFLQALEKSLERKQAGDAGIKPAAHLGAGFQPGRVVPRAVPRAGQS